MSKSETVTVARREFYLVLGEDVDSWGELNTFDQALAAYKSAKARMEQWYADRDLALARSDDRVKPDKRDLNVVLHNWQAAGFLLANTEAKSLGDVRSLLEEAAQITAVKGIDHDSMAAMEFGFIVAAAKAIEDIQVDLMEARRKGREAGQ